MIDHNERSRVRTALIGTAALLVVLLALLAWGRGCRADSLPAPLEGLLARLEAPGTPTYKLDLVRQAIAHKSNTFRAHTLYYHPRETCNDPYHSYETCPQCEKWIWTATGTRVRPGIASCTQAYRSRWMGAWIWFADHGITHVEDCFPESRSPITFDLAVWANDQSLGRAFPLEGKFPGPSLWIETGVAHQSYDDWLRDGSRVKIARNRNVWTDAVVLKPKGGWPQ